MAQIIRQLIPQGAFHELQRIGCSRYVLQEGVDVRVGDQLRLISWDEVNDRPAPDGDVIEWEIRGVDYRGSSRVLRRDGHTVA